MRGKGVLDYMGIPTKGITPAYAGKSLVLVCTFQILQDHPRVCGEKRTAGRPVLVERGSPPRMRGKVCFLGCISVLTGITPAYAGKSYLIGTGLSDTKDHPRVCGEKTVLDLSRLVEQGSPPRMRGKVDNVRRGQAHPGITPAYAGKRCVFRSCL